MGICGYEALVRTTDLLWSMVSFSSCHWSVG